MDYPVELKNEIQSLLEKLKIRELYEPQKIGMDLIFSGKNVVISMPTASGKTLLAYFAILRAMALKMRALYLVPLRALAMEKYDELKEIFDDKYNIILSMGDYDTNAKDLEKADIIVAVFEKIDSVLRHDPDFIYSIGVIVADEVHILGDESRGPTLEMILTRLLVSNSHAQLVALSATISNYDEIADWLRAEKLYSDFRPVPLKIGIYQNGILFYDNGESYEIKEDKLKIGNLVKFALRDNGQVLIFVSRRNFAEKLAENLRSIVMNYAEKIDLPKQIDEEKNIYDEKIIDNLRYGVAFHHAGLSNTQRKFIENLFRERKIKCLVATPTLAAGVNLPARTVIVRDITRYSDGFSVDIPVFEIKQMLGRAGRPKYDKYGEGIVVARTREMDFDFLHYPEKVESKLDEPSSLRMHVLGLIASGIVDNIEDVLNFFSKTFMAYQGKLNEYEIERTIEFLIENELVTNVRKLKATPFGKMVSDLYLDPITGIMFRDSLKEKYNEFRVLYTISLANEMVKLTYHDEQLYVPEFIDEPDMDALKTAYMLNDWMNEKDMDEIIEKYGIGPGDVHMRVEIADWLLYSYLRLASIEKVPYIKNIEDLWIRIKYGIRNELLELVQLPNVGRVRARRLYSMGYRTLSDIANSDVKKISSIPGFGEKLAAFIVEEARKILKTFKY